MLKHTSYWLKQPPAPESHNKIKTKFEYVLANPPFGKKSSMTFTNEEGEQEKEDLTYNRQGFWVTTSNNQEWIFVYLCEQ